jgi:hypothetical protein
MEKYNVGNWVGTGQRDTASERSISISYVFPLGLVFFFFFFFVVVWDSLF